MGITTLLAVTSFEIIILVLVGLAAGTLGGMLGIGGSIIVIPALAILLGRSQHLAQASAMIVNVFVALPAAYRHHQAGAVRWDVFWRMLVFGIVFILIGVEISDLFERRFEPTLQSIFGAYLLYVIANNILHMARRQGEPTIGEQRPTWLRTGFAGSVTGFAAGLLGIGGGTLAVPLLQRVCRLPLRQCIATSSTVMVITAAIGAFRKNMTLPTHLTDAGDPIAIADSLLIAACLIPTAMVGGFLGARLTHVLPLRWVRLAFLLLLALAALRMLGVGRLLNVW